MARGKKNAAGLWGRIDYILFVVSSIAGILGMLAIYSATLSMPDTIKYVIIQLVAYIIGIGLFFLMSVIDYGKDRIYYYFC